MSLNGDFSRTNGNEITCLHRLDRAQNSCYNEERVQNNYCIGFMEVFGHLANSIVMKLECSSTRPRAPHHNHFSNPYDRQLSFCCFTIRLLTTSLSYTFFANGPCAAQFLGTGALFLVGSSHFLHAVDQASRNRSKRIR